MLGLISGILGIALLISGRKLFWLFIAALGFIVGIQLTTTFWHNGSDWITILIGIAVGLVCALIAIFVQTVAIGIAGFLSGGYALTTLAGMVGFNAGNLAWIVYIVGGIIGLALVSFLFDWAIITLSSLAGATLITQNLLSQAGNAQTIFIILFLAGVLIQGTIFRNENGQKQRSHSPNRSQHQ